MGISITDDAIVLDNCNVTFENIYQYAVSVNSNKVSKLSNTYLITTNIIMQNNAYLSDVDKSITITGDLFQIKKGCTLKLGLKNYKGDTSRGCILTMPNILQEYGFGSIYPEDSGNLLSYNSMINIYGFWSFFAGDNFVDIVDSIIDGYGKVSGPNTVVKDTVFKRAHGLYGTLIYEGVIKTYENITVKSVEAFTDMTQNIQSNNILNIANSTAGDDISIYYGSYSGYSNLLYVMDTVYDYSITLFGTLITNGYNINRENPNKNDFFHKFRFKPRFQDMHGSVLANVPVLIKNKLGEIEWEGLTDNYGYVDTWLTYYRDLAGPSPGEIVTPHIVEINYADISIVANIFMDRNMEDFPILLYTYADASNIAALQNLVVTSDTEIKAYLDQMATDIRTVLAATGATIRESTTTVVKRSGQKIHM